MELPPFWFAKASVIWGRVSKLLRGGGVGVSCSLDTLPRWRLRLQTKMAATPSKRTSLENPMEK